MFGISVMSLCQHICFYLCVVVCRHQAALPSAQGRWEEVQAQAEAPGNLCNKTCHSTWWLERVCASPSTFPK